MNDSPEPAGNATSRVRRRFRIRRLFLQFSLRTLLIVTTVAAVACWWFLQPQNREEQLARGQLKLRRQVRLQESEAIDFTASSGVVQTSRKDGVGIVNSGRWRLRDKHDDLLVSGRYENDQPHGKWTIYHVNGRKAAEGEALAGARNGLWQTWDEEGHQLTEVTYQSVTWNWSKGFDIDQLPPWIGCGSIYVSQKQRRQESLLRRLQQPGQRDRHKSVRHGAARAWRPSGKLRFEGHYENDRRHGRWIFYDEQSRLTAAGEYKDDKREGSWQELDPIGNQPRQVDYVAGRTRAEHERLMGQVKADLSTDSPRRRAQAAATLLAVGDAATPLLLELLDSASEEVKLIAATSLEQLSAVSSEAVPKLMALTRSSNSRLSITAMRCVFRASPEHREALFGRLMQEVRRARDIHEEQCTLYTICAVDPHRCSAAITELAQLAIRQERERATSQSNNLPGINYADIAADLPGIALEAVSAALDSSEPRVRRFVMQIIQEIVYRQPPITIRHVVAGKPQAQYDVPAELQPLVERGKNDPHVEVRQAAEVVGHFPGGFF